MGKSADGTEIQIDAGGGGFGSLPIKTTRQDEILMHLVSDGDLNDLAQSRTGWMENLLWAMVGGAIGAFIPAMEAIYVAFCVEPRPPFSILILLKIIVFIVTAALGGLAAFVVYRKGKTGKQLLDEIRNRPKY